MNTKLRRIASRLLTIALLVASGIVSGTSAQAATLAQADLYNPAKITEINLTIPPASAISLNNRSTARTYTAASVTISSGGASIGPVEIGLRLKGTTSFELLKGTPSFKLKFNWSSLKGQRFLGLKNMTLNSMTQDGSKLHEFASYKLFNAMSVQAPRTGWAAVKVNGVDRGLYVNIETYDDVFLTSRFKDTTLHLYEGSAFNDLKIGTDGGAKDTGPYSVKEGWGAVPNKNDLTALIKAANQSNPATWWKQLATVTDRSQLIRMWAVENFVGQWDGYSGPIINNFFLRSNTAGKFVMLPWGTDNTFGENRQTDWIPNPIFGDNYFFAMDKPAVGYPWSMQVQHVAAMNRGMLFRMCLVYKTCKTEYLTALKLVSARANSIKLVTAMNTAAKLLAPYTNDVAKAEQIRTAAWVAKQQVKVAALLKLNKIK
jgi:spore coat protein CotH